MTQIETKTRLLDAAESLFSHQGFAGTSLRAITTKAEANLAAVNYYFGSKEDLLNSVLKRRLVPLNQLRSDRIDAVLATAVATGNLPGTEDLLRAFIEPTMAFRRSKSGSSEFVGMLGRLMTAADPMVRDCFLELIRPLINKLHKALCLALPRLPEDLIYTRLFFTMGAMGHCICFAGIVQILKTSPARTPGDDAMTNNLINFVTAGLEAPC